MTTPNARIEPVVPDRPRKRKRQAVDNVRKLTDEKIKRNHLTVMDTLRDQVRPKGVESVNLARTQSLGTKKVSDKAVSSLYIWIKNVSHSVRKVKPRWQNR